MLPGEAPVETVVAVLEDSRKIKQPPSRFYRPELDVLRFLAFSMVFIDHSLPYDGVFTDGRLLGSIRYAGGFGVCVFFMLSSFLITDLLEREHAVTHTIQLRAFYVRRILRIWPLYFSFLFFDFSSSKFGTPTTSPLGSCSPSFYLLETGGSAGLASNITPPRRRYGASRLKSSSISSGHLFASTSAGRAPSSWRQRCSLCRTSNWPGFAIPVAKVSGQTLLFSFNSSAQVPSSRLLFAVELLSFQRRLAWLFSQAA